MAAYSINAFGSLVRAADGRTIPRDPANTDYAAYLDWNTKGGIADPYVAPTVSAAQAAITKLQADDALMFRGLEILIDALLKKGTITAADFPDNVRTAYLARKALRQTAGYALADPVTPSVKPVSPA